ncbi:MAG TPA: efflux RND transporter periplasmic adaptor subunit, partial [Gemmatimonadales bacterium]|nr:efflux RND transporter periplasmic adaptor subunit [Gemmatimonadales bacterium]
MNGLNLPRATFGVALAAALAAPLALAGCKGNDDAKAETAAPVPPMTVGPENIAVADSTLLEAGPVVSGTLAPAQQATLRAEVGGTVLRTFAEQGQKVKRGQVLARIEAQAQQDALLSARAAVRTAESQAVLARRNAERSATLAKAGAIADRDLETAQQQAAVAEAAVADARARLASAQKQVANATVEAPFDGIVSERQVDAGDVVQPGAALFTVVDNARLQLEASVPAEQLADLKVGTTVRFTVNGLPDTTFTGKIERINPTADPAT